MNKYRIIEIRKKHSSKFKIQKRKAIFFWSTLANKFSHGYEETRWFDSGESCLEYLKRLEETRYVKFITHTVDDSQLNI